MLASYYYEASLSSAKFIISMMLQKFLSVAIICVYSMFLQAQQLSLGGKLGINVINLNKYVPDNENVNYETWNPLEYNDGWAVSLYTKKNWVLYAAFSSLQQSSGIQSSFRDEFIFRAGQRSIVAPNKTLSFRIGKRMYLGESKFSVIPHLGLGITNIETGYIPIGGGPVLQLHNYFYDEGWVSSIQTSINVGYELNQKHRFSIQALTNIGLRYYVFYNFRIFDAQGLFEHVTVSSKGDLIAIQLRYEYLFDLRKKQKALRVTP